MPKWRRPIFRITYQADGGEDGGGAIAAVFQLKRIVNVRKINVAPITTHAEVIGAHPIWTVSTTNNVAAESATKT